MRQASGDQVLDRTKLACWPTMSGMASHNWLHGMLRKQGLPACLIAGGGGEDGSGVDVLLCWYTQCKPHAKA
eukprot:364726-Chlamydomonas_euryale.AAC.3